ncbi:WXG100 family type VII secretion target [Hamadaea tsunoensis]|uniref:WXG100 family type VII secretion target n=1 Tax=Hamadaea tsunoensis TaxID=53368 RepID=UPI0003F5777E|nr:WXG100 family type VII secretion target [Hamadaea tsunoensis]
MQPNNLLHASPAELQAAAHEIGLAYQTLNSIQTKLTGELDPLLLGKAWEGPAGREFKSLYHRYATQVNRIHRSLELLGELIRKSGGHYDAGEVDAHHKVSTVDVPTNITSVLSPAN